eukprot:Pgem_evm1s18752
MSSFNIVSIRFYNTTNCSGQFFEALNEIPNTCKTGYSDQHDSYAFIKEGDKYKLEVFNSSNCYKGLDFHGKETKPGFASLKPETCFAADSDPSKNPSVKSNATALPTSYKAYSYHVKSVPNMANSVTYDNAFDASMACKEKYFSALMNKNNQCKYYCGPTSFIDTYFTQTGKITSTEGCVPYENTDINDKNDKLPITKGPVYTDINKAAKACDEKAAADKDNKMKSFSSFIDTFNGRCTYLCKMDKVKLEGSCDGKEHDTVVKQQHPKPTKGPVYTDIIKASKACDEKSYAEILFL